VNPTNPAKALQGLCDALTTVRKIVSTTDMPGREHGLAPWKF